MDGNTLGLNLFDKNTEQFHTYKNVKNDVASLSGKDILCLRMDQNKKLGIGTSFGLNMLQDLKSDGAVFKSYTTKGGLPNN